MDHFPLPDEPDVPPPPHSDAVYWRLLSLPLGLGTLLLAGSVLVAALTVDSQTLAGNDVRGEEHAAAVAFVDVKGGVSQLYPVQPGRITKLPVQEGASVKKGDLLLQVDDTLAKVREEEAKIALNVAQATGTGGGAGQTAHEDGGGAEGGRRGDALQGGSGPGEGGQGDSLREGEAAGQRRGRESRGEDGGGSRGGAERGEGQAGRGRGDEPEDLGRPGPAGRAGQGAATEEGGVRRAGMPGDRAERRHLVAAAGERRRGAGPIRRSRPWCSGRRGRSSSGRRWSKSSPAGSRSISR